jgi:UBX domain-containing protein 1/4
MRFKKKKKIKPLTEEEKVQKLAELRGKMSEKRVRKAAEEAKEAKANELIRRKAGKVRLIINWTPPTLHQLWGSHVSTGIRADQRRSKEQAASKRPRSKAPWFVLILLLPSLFTPTRPDPTRTRTPRLCDRKRPIFTEKENDKKALAAIKAQIEADKRERAQKAAQEKALRDGSSTVTAAGTSAPAVAAAAATPPAATSSIPGREFKETRLQIRLSSGGQPLTTTLPSDSSCVSTFSFLSVWKKKVRPIL